MLWNASFVAAFWFLYSDLMVQFKAILITIVKHKALSQEIRFFHKSELKFSGLQSRDLLSLEKAVMVILDVFQ